MVKRNAYLTVGDAVACIGRNADTLRRWDRANRLPARRDVVTAHRLYPLRELDELLGEFCGVGMTATAGKESRNEPPRARFRKHRSWGRRFLSREQRLPRYAGRGGQRD
ncbi:MAG: hypothetical protein ACE5FA_11195 [Dehalococcoidia bacterium]